MGSFYRSQHELVFVYKHGHAPHTNTFGLGGTGRYRTNVWRYAGVNSFGSDRLEQLAMHPTVKPVAMVADAIKDCSRRGEIVLDPFAGSGTTLMAAERTARIARCLELDPRYVDVAVRRWESQAGQPALHAESGHTFSETAAERARADRGPRRCVTALKTVPRRRPACAAGTCLCRQPSPPVGAQPGEATEPYAVGYGKPPASTQFKKGQSGNPKGRPTGARNTMTIVREILDREVTVRGGDGQRRITGREANFTALLQKALKGDVRALKLVHDIAVQLDEDLVRDASLDPGQAETPAPLSDEDEAVLAAFEHDPALPSWNRRRASRRRLVTA